MEEAQNLVYVVFELPHKCLLLQHNEMHLVSFCSKWKCLVANPRSYYVESMKEAISSFKLSNHIVL